MKIFNVKTSDIKKVAITIDSIELLITLILRLLTKAISVKPYKYHLENKTENNNKVRIFLIFILIFTAILSSVAQAAEVTIDNASDTATLQRNSGIDIFINATHGYRFYLDSGNIFGYKTTANGGETWSGTTTTIEGSGNNIAYAAWYDGWTPGRTSEYIQLAYVSMSTAPAKRTLFYRNLNTTTNALGTQTPIVVNGPPAPGGSATTVFLSISENETGTIFISFPSTSAATGNIEQIWKCSTTCTTAGNWAGSGAGTPLTADAADLVRLIPRIGGNMTAVRNTVAGHVIDYSTYNKNTQIWSSWTTIGSCVDSTTPGYQDANIATLSEPSEDEVYVACLTNPGTISIGNVTFYRFTPGSTADAVSTVYPPITNQYVDNVAMAKDVVNDVVYVVYNRGTSASSVRPYYRRSFDDGKSWDTEVALSASAGANYEFTLNQNVTNQPVYVTYGRSTAMYGELIVNTSLTKYLVNQPMGFTYASGSNFINTSWTAPSGNITDTYLISVNGNNSMTTNTFYNQTGMIGNGWSNITVQAVNGTNAGNVSTPASINTQLILVSVTARSNNYTNNNTVSITVPSFTTVNFSVTTNTPSNTSITCDFTNKSSGATFIGNSTCTPGTINGTFAFNTAASQYVNIGVTQFGMTMWTNWSVTVTDHYNPTTPTNFTNRTDSVFGNSIGLQWNESSDADDAINHYVIEKTNESFNWLTNPRPEINASSDGAANYNADAYWYEYRTPIAVPNCGGCHGAVTKKDIYSGNFWIKYDASYLYMWAMIPDNDTASNDDDVDLMFDVNKDRSVSLKSDDRYYELLENGTLRLKIGNDTSGQWEVGGSTSATVAVTGAGTKGVLYEMRIPLSEIGSSTNGSSTVWAFEHECSDGGSGITRDAYFPASVNENNPSTWNTGTYRNTPDYVWIANTTQPSYTATGLIGNYKYNFSVYAVDSNGNAGGRVSKLVSTLNAMSYSVSGYVQNILGMGISNANVSTGESYIEHTDSTGKYSMQFVNGTYDITGEKNGFYTRTSQQTVSGADKVNVNLTITTDSSFTVSLPIGYLVPEFSPSTANESNLNPGGQSSGVAFFQFTNDGNIPQTFRMYLDSVVTNINLYADLDNNHNSERVLIDSTTSTVIVSELAMEGGVQNVWLLADFNRPPPGTYNETLTVNSS